MKNIKIEIGTTKNIGGEEFIILDALENGVLCLSKDFAYTDTMFDSDSNNYANSSIRKLLNTEYFKKLADAVGEENIIETEIDLTSDDGLDDYGKVTDKVGLFTVDMYRKYNRIIEKYPVDDWWWLATPYSTPHRDYNFSVRCVSDCGSVNDDCCGLGIGVRPFLIFNPSIF